MTPRRIARYTTALVGVCGTLMRAFTLRDALQVVRRAHIQQNGVTVLLPHRDFISPYLLLWRPTLRLPPAAKGPQPPFQR